MYDFKSIKNGRSDRETERRSVFNAKVCKLQNMAQKLIK